jgi:hypothetical protein
MALTPSTARPLAPPPLRAVPSVEELHRLTGWQIASVYGPEVYAMVGRLQASGALARDSRTHYDLAVTQQVRMQIIAQEGDCRCGKIDCWKREMGLHE